MIEDFLCDPVLAVRWLMGREMDEFQKVRLKLMWWVPHLMDGSGISTGKTFTDFAYAYLRALLIVSLSDFNRVGVYFPTFQQGKDTFWVYFRQINAPLFRASLGDVEDPDGAKDGKRHDPSCWTARLRSGGEILMPAPDVKGESGNQASRRFNTIIFEEFTKFDAAGNAINAELIGRATREGYNQFHPLWSNHLKFMGHAEPQDHPAFKRYQEFGQRIRGGDPRCAVISFSYKDWSDLPNHEGRSFKDAYRDNATLEAQKAHDSQVDFLSKGLGLWVKNGRGWYSPAALEACVERGRQLGLLPQVGRRAEEVWVEPA